MASTLRRFDHFVSLGYICSVPEMLNALKLERRAYPLDHLAVPAWAVAELFANDFVDILDDGNMEKKQIFADTTKEFLVDTKYNIRTVHSSHTSPQYQKFKTRIHQLVERLHQLLSTTEEEVLFIRTEEVHNYGDMGARIGDPAYAAKYASTELHWLQQLSQTLKAKYPNLHFKILFMSRSGQFCDKTHNIVGIGCTDCDYREHCIGTEMVKKLDDHAAYLNAYL